MTFIQTGAPARSAFHGIKHHSPTALNMAAANLPLYFMERVLGYRGAASLPMMRGIASETGIVHGLLHPTCPVQECQDLALAEYDQKAPKQGLATFASALQPEGYAEKCDKERDAIPGIVEQGILALRPYGVPDEVQVRIGYQMPGVALPMTGFCDLGWTVHGIRLDIKSQLKLMSQPSDGYRRQVAAYLYGTNMAGRVACIAPKKHAVYAVADPADDMNALIQIARRLERFLSLSTDPQELSALLIPDFSSFFWSGEMRMRARTVFGF